MQEPAIGLQRHADTDHAASIEWLGTSLTILKPCVCCLLSYCLFSVICYFVPVECFPKDETSKGGRRCLSPDCRARFGYKLLVKYLSAWSTQTAHLATCLCSTALYRASIVGGRMGQIPLDSQEGAETERISVHRATSDSPRLFHQRLFFFLDAPRN